MLGNWRRVEGVEIPWNEDGAEQIRRSEVTVHWDLLVCILLPTVLWVFAFAILVVGSYGSFELVLGPNCSRLLQANSLFVKEIDVQNENHTDGSTSMLYGFKNKPILDSVNLWSYKHQLTVEANYHKEISLMLNKGSTVDLEYNVVSSGFLDMIVAAVQGKDGLSDWKEDPSNPRLAMSWYNVHGRGNVSVKVVEDDEYFLAFGNINRQDLKMELKVTIQSTQYSTGTAVYSCILHENNLCGMELFFPGFDYAVVATPDVKPGEWYGEWLVTVSYGKRWAVYLMSLGGVVIFVISGLKLFQMLNSQSLLEPRQPFISNQSIAQSLAETVDHDIQACAICYNDSRTTFFDPCGHCIACHSCSIRIFVDGCPICRSKIQHVRKIYTC